MKFEAPGCPAIHAMFRARTRPGPARCFVFAPGFAQHNGTRTMRDVHDLVLAHGDLLGVDFRGTGGSEGRFRFGAEEFADLEAPLRWARARYPRVELIGLSLGAYHSVRAAHAWPELVDRLLLVSCPTRVEEIVTSGAVLRHAIAFPFRPIEWGKERQLLFRWAYPFHAKPDATGLAAELRMPVSFAIGTRDRLVPPWMSRRVFEACAPGRASWREFAGGNHAEELFYSHPAEMGAWLEVT